MIANVPFWRRPFGALLIIALVVALGAWLALDRPMPDEWFGDESAGEIRMPEFLRRSDPDRLFCAESPDTGICRCITASGQRPDIGEEECRRRVSESATEMEKNQ